MFNDRFRNFIKQAKPYPGADMNSDHNPVVVKINMKLKRTNATKRSEQPDLNLLKKKHTNTSTILKYTIFMEDYA